MKICLSIIALFHTVSTNWALASDNEGPQNASERRLNDNFNQVTPTFGSIASDQNFVAEPVMGSAVGGPVNLRGMIEGQRYALAQAFEQNDLEEIREVLRVNPLLMKAQFGNLNQTPMMLAIEKGWRSFVTVMAEFEDLTKQNMYGHTSLMLAAEKSMLDGLEALLQYATPEDLKLADTAGQTVLIHAIYRSTPEVVKALLDAGVNPNDCGQQIYHPLLQATQNATHGLDIVKLLQEKGATFTTAQADQKKAFDMWLAQRQAP